MIRMMSNRTSGMGNKLQGMIGTEKRMQLQEENL